jgi:hypothetical protein
MKLTLERKDLLVLLGKQLGFVLNDEDVTVQADPFEVQIKQVPTAEIVESARTESKVRKFPESETDTQDQLAKKIMTMAEVLEKNAALGGPRPLGPEEFEDPPTISESELYGTRR